MTAIVALETFSDLDRKITLSEDIFYTLNGQDATQAGFQPGEDVYKRQIQFATASLNISVPESRKSDRILLVWKITSVC